MFRKEPANSVQAHRLWGEVFVYSPEVPSQDGMPSIPCRSWLFTVSHMYDLKLLSYDGHHDKRYKKTQ